MDEGSHPIMTAATSRRLAVLGTVGAVALFFASIHAAGVGTVLAGMRRVGQGFVLIVLIGLARIALRAMAWSTCAGGSARLPFDAAFAACLVGEAAGNLTPLGLAASEPAKVLCVRGRCGTMESAASLAVETLLYSLSVVAMIVLGTAAWLGAVASRRAALPGAAVLGLLVLAVAAWWPRHAVAWDRVCGWLERQATRRERLRPLADAARRTRDILGDLRSKQPRTLGWLLALEMAFHAASTVEVWLALLLLGGGDSTFLGAFLLDYANRVVSVVFKFVPLRAGVDEAASGAMASALGAGATTGVTLAVVRKARVLVLCAAGVAIAGKRAAAARCSSVDSLAVAPVEDPARMPR